MYVKVVYYFIFFCLGLNTFNYGIRDVSFDDVSYFSIKKSVDEGYFFLDKGKFKPLDSTTRKDIAIVIDKLSEDIKKGRLLLTGSEMQDLRHLSRSTRLAISSLKSKIDKVESDLNAYKGEVKALRYDIEKLMRNVALYQKSIEEYTGKKNR